MKTLPLLVICLAVLKFSLLGRRSGTVFILAFVAFLAAIATSKATDTTYTWSGNDSASWSDSGNWSAIPLSNVNTALFFSNSSQLSVNQDTGATFNLNTMTFSSTSGAYSLTGGDLQFRQNSAGTLPTITLNSASAITIANTVELDASGPLTVGGTGAGSITLQNVDGSGGLTQAGSETLILAGTSTYTGATTASNGTLIMQGTATFNSASLVVDAGGTLTIATGATVGNSNGGSVIVGNTGGGTGAATFNISGGTLFSGTMTLGAGGENAIVNQTGGTNNVTGNRLIMGEQGASTYNLSGGTLVTLAVLGESGNSTFNFNGGAFEAAAGSSGGDTLDGLTKANVQAGGAIVNSNGNTITFMQPLVHESSLGATPDGGLTISGAGGLMLSAPNTYTGPTTINGTLVLPTSSSIADSSGVNLATSGASLQLFNVGESQTIQDLTGVAGTTIDLPSGSTLTAGTANSTTFAGVFAQGGTLVKQGSGTLTLTGANTSNGEALIVAGTLQVQGALPSANIFVDAGATFSMTTGSTVGIANSGTIRVGNTTGANVATFNLSGGALVGGEMIVGFVSGGTAVVNQTGGTNTISSAPGLIIGDGGAGAYLLSGGTLTAFQITSNTNSGTFDFNGGNLQIPTASAGTFFSGLTVNVQAGGALINIATSPISINVPLLHDPNLTSTPDGGLTKQGTGMLTFNGANTYTGPTTINAGTLVLGANASLASSSGVNLAASGAIFSISAASQTIQDFAGVSGTTVKLGPSTLTVGTADSTTFGGVITQSGALVKQGAGTLTLTGANTYSGGTTVVAGFLNVNNSTGSSTGTGMVAVSSGGALGGAGVIAPSGVASGTAVNIASGGVLAPSNGSGAASQLTLALNPGTALNLTLGANFVFDLGASSASSDEVFVNGGTTTLNGQNFGDFTFNAESGFGPGTFTLINDPAGLTGSLGGTVTGTVDGYQATLFEANSDQNLELQIMAAPEPGSGALLVAGLAFLAGWRPRRTDRRRPCLGTHFGRSCGESPDKKNLATNVNPNAQSRVSGFVQTPRLPERLPGLRPGCWSAALLFLVAARLLTGMALGDWVVETKSEDTKGTQITVTKVKGRKMRVDMLDTPAGPISLILDTASGDSITIIHAMKAFQKVSAADKQRQRNEIWSKAPGKIPKLEDTGQKEKVGNFDCEIYAIKDGELNMRVWKAANHPQSAVLKMNDELLGGNLPEEADYNKLPGVMLKMEIVGDGKKTTKTIVSVKEQNLEASEFDAPAGYAAVGVPEAPPGSGDGQPPAKTSSQAAPNPEDATLAHTAAEGWIVEWMYEGPAEHPMSIVTKLKGDKMRVDQGRYSTITDAATGGGMVIDHEQKSAVKEAPVAAGVRDKFAELARLIEPKYQATGQKEKVGEYECEIYKAVDGAITTREWVCMDYPKAAVLKALTERNRRVQSSGPMELYPRNLPGVVLKSEEAWKGARKTAVLTSVKQQDIGASEFEVPADYKIVIDPFGSTPAAKPSPEAGAKPGSAATGNAAGAGALPPEGVTITLRPQNTGKRYGASFPDAQMPPNPQGYFWVVDRPDNESKVTALHNNQWHVSNMPGHYKIQVQYRSGNVQKTVSNVLEVTVPGAATP